MRESAFGIKVPETQEEHYAKAKAEERRRAYEMAFVFGNRARRRHRWAGAPGERRPLTPRQRATRRVRRAMAKASRRANR